jgi:hypothetical protein
MYVNKYITVMSQSKDQQVPENQPTRPDSNPIDEVLENRTDSQSRSNRMILIGAPAWVRRMIHLLHVARITEVRDWSPMIPTQNLNEVISLVQRPRVEE